MVVGPIHGSVPPLLAPQGRGVTNKGGPTAEGAQGYTLWVFEGQLRYAEWV